MLITNKKQAIIAGIYNSQQGYIRQGEIIIVIVIP